MADFAVDLDLTPFQREQAVRHCEVTYNLCYGGLERMTANFFRVPVAECVSEAAPAVALRELIAQFGSTSGPVRLKVAGMTKFDRLRLSELLKQTTVRPYRDGDTDLGRELERLWREFDRHSKLPGDEQDRAEHLGYEASVRESASARREAERLQRSLAGA